MNQNTVRAAAVATFSVFAINGFVFASWAARIPAVTRILDLTAGEMGLLLLTIAAGSVIALPLAGTVVARIGTAHTIRTGGFTAAFGGLIISLALSQHNVPLTAVGLFFFGIGIGLWDVAQNIEGADVERHLGRTVMPQFHAGFSGGALIGALVGAGLSALDVSMSAHLLVIVLGVSVAMVFVPKLFLPETATSGSRSSAADKAGKGRSAWTEKRTLMVGLVVLGAALTEGSANDWIAKATVDGLGSTEAGGAIMFAVFVASMTLFRFFGGSFVDKFGRVPVLYGSLGSALLGLVVFVVAPNLLLAAVGAVLWGAGSAMGFPMGMSAAADDPARAAARVSVVSTIGYVAFLAGPPLLGFLGDHFTIRWALLAIAVAIIASILTAPAAKPLPKSEYENAAN
ncbi:MFS family permease [Arthrobacter stackebrandtii]|uniref:MFS family permease n=1 Tax=Arthrobacter stackebrandtii TaxID=272161 RepID=A0ABS4YVA5_9MICC|nr:MFS transporter [Arthrobacter stackebrandtii]MBP2412736.1 MFS family permease [Arthrobacter stackebrandtii]PYG99904.1 MFS transporter [Arthrobacter stackebrandtii]